MSFIGVGDLGTVNSSVRLTQYNAAVPWGAADVQSTTKFDGDVVRAGLNYHLY